MRQCKHEFNKTKFVKKFFAYVLSDMFDRLWRTIGQQFFTYNDPIPEERSSKKRKTNDSISSNPDTVTLEETVVRINGDEQISSDVHPEVPQPELVASVHAVDELKMTRSESKMLAVFLAESGKKSGTDVAESRTVSGNGLSWAAVSHI